MSFDTLPFLVFFLGVYAAYRTIPSTGFVLLAASAAYYAFAGLHDFLLFLCVIVTNFALGLLMRPGSRAVLAVAVLFNVLVLAWFKYRTFLLGAEMAQSFTTSVAIPLGISFYTFQSMAYLADLYRGEIAAERSLLRFSLFKSFFPQLVAGPIVRAHILLPQVKRLFEGLARSPRFYAFGLALCLLGVIKKVVLSDSLAPFADDIFTNGPANLAMAWLGAWLFAFQIYFDFSGYSDMAVGMAWLLGIRLPINFATPYLALSPREFWQRWHITLSTWIRDYLYIPLGGSRRGGAVRQSAILVAVMGLAGFWHGANWTFIAWGLLWGGAIAAWRLGGDAVASLPAVVRWLATLALVLTLWVFFRAPDIDFAIRYLGVMWGASPFGSAQYFSDAVQSLLIAAGAGALIAVHAAERALASRGTLLWLKARQGPFLAGAMIAIICWLLVSPKALDNPFIYFRF